MRIVMATIELPAYFLKRKLAANAIIIIGMSRYSSMTKNLKNYLKFPPSAFSIEPSAFRLQPNSPFYQRSNCWQRLPAWL